MTEIRQERASIQTLVAARGDGQWRLASFQNTRVRPMGRSLGTFLVWTLGDLLWRVFRLSTDPKPVNPCRSLAAAGSHRLISGCSTTPASQR